MAETGGFWSDIGTAVGGGLSKTAVEFYTAAQDKFIERIARRKPKTVAERNIRREFAQTQTGQQAEVDYISRRASSFFQRPEVMVLIAVLALGLIVGLRR